MTMQVSVLEKVLQPHWVSVHWKEDVASSDLSFIDALALLEARLRWYGIRDWHVVGVDCTPDQGVVTAQIADGDHGVFARAMIDCHSSAVTQNILQHEAVANRQL